MHYITLTSIFISNNALTVGSKIIFLLSRWDLMKTLKMMNKYVCGKTDCRIGRCLRRNHIPLVALLILLLIRKRQKLCWKSGYELALYLNQFAKISFYTFYVSLSFWRLQIFAAIIDLRLFNVLFDNKKLATIRLPFLCFKAWFLLKRRNDSTNMNGT